MHWLPGRTVPNLWILSREPAMPVETLEQMIDPAKKLGYDRDKLIYVAHDQTGLN